MSKKKVGNSGVIQAAGGLLWRDSAQGRQLAVIYRSRYDDWALPKGWREKGETFLAAAEREVIEETNCRVAVGPFAGCTSYTVNGIPKIVLFWHMSLIGNCVFEPDDEVDRLAWLTVQQALTRLSYKGERKMLADAV